MNAPIDKTLKTEKTVVVAVRVPLGQREAMEKAAVTARLSLSAYIKATMDDALRGKARPRPEPAPVVTPAAPAAGVISLSDPAAVAELKRIGININQIAHAANAGLPADVSLTVHSFARLFEALAEPEAFRKRLEAIKAAPARQEPAKPAPQPAQPAPAPTPQPKPAPVAMTVSFQQPPAAPPQPQAQPAPTRWVMPPRPSAHSPLPAKRPARKPNESPLPRQSRLAAGLAALIKNEGRS